jgi:predicted  nucleic acid-binding Zn-ribbon protein
VNEFEKVLSKLRGLATKVVDETAAGDDVTDQFVDLQSQLTNLEATRARIQDFLKDARTIDEALRINQELSNIEGQIEQIKGQMNYLND